MLPVRAEEPLTGNFTMENDNFMPFDDAENCRFQIVKQDVN